MPDVRTSRDPEAQNGFVSARDVVARMREEGRASRGPGDLTDAAQGHQEMAVLEVLAGIAHEDAIRSRRAAEAVRNGTDKTCGKCGKPIAPKRLVAHGGNVRTCIACQELIEAGEVDPLP